MSFLPYLLAPPVDRMETIGNSRTGKMQIRSIAALSKPEKDYFTDNRTNLYMMLAKAALRAHNGSGKRHKFEDVFDTLRAPILGRAPKIAELEGPMLDFQKVYDKAQDENDALMAVAILRHRVPSLANLTIESFRDESKVPAAMQRVLIEFAQNENLGWPDDKDGIDPEISTAEAPAAPTEEEAGK